MEKTVLPQTDQQHRIFYADVLRFVAIFAVIVLHCSSDYVSQYGEISGQTWWTGTAYNGLSRICIPLFIMLSGAFLLKPGKYVSLKELFGKRLPKILIPLVFWSILYVCWETSRSEEGWQGFNLKETLQTFYEGPVIYHFWFLYMMVGIYLIYPVINAFIGTAKDIDLRYFLLVWLLANSILFLIDSFTGWTLGFDLNSFTGYIGYFVLGYYLNTRVHSTSRCVLYLVGMVIGMLATVFIPWLLYRYNADLVNDFTESDFTPDVILAAAGFFVVVKHLLQNSRPNKWIYSIVNSVSIDAFGIYLVHVMVLEYIFSDDRSYTEMLVDHPAWGIPLQSLVILIISYIIVKLIRQIPVLNKVIG